MLVVDRLNSDSVLSARMQLADLVAQEEIKTCANFAEAFTSDWECSLKSSVALLSKVIKR